MAISFRTVSPSCIRSSQRTAIGCIWRRATTLRTCTPDRCGRATTSAPAKSWRWTVTPMIGGVFGRTNGIAPGCEASLTYKKVEFAISNEYVFDTTHKSGSFYYAWLELTYSPTKWFRVGVVGEHTKAFRTSLKVQRALLVGVSHKKWEFTTYIFNAGFTDPTVVLEVGVSF